MRSPSLDADIRDDFFPEFSTRIRHCFRNETAFGVDGQKYCGLPLRTINDLTQWSEADLLGMPNFGPKCLKDVKSYLASVGLHLSVDRSYDDGISIADDIDYQGIESLVMAGG